MPRKAYFLKGTIDGEEKVSGVDDWTTVAGKTRNDRHIDGRGIRPRHGSDVETVPFLRHLSKRLGNLPVEPDHDPCVKF